MTIAFILATMWSCSGLFFYVITAGKVKKQFQKIVRMILSGPLIWFLIPASWGLDIAYSRLLIPFYRWLTKE